jgi:hypothetical protein
MRTHGITLATAAAALLTLAHPAAGAAEVDTSPSALEVRFCPGKELRGWPLESRRGVHGVLLQNALVHNRGSAPLELVAIDLELLAGGEVVDSRRLTGEALVRAGAAGPALQSSGQLALLAFQFCGDQLVPAGTRLGGPTLAPGEALLLMQQPFAFRGDRDTLRVRIHARGGTGEVSGAGELPVRLAPAATAFRFPLQGRWFVAVGATMHTGHRWARPEEFGLDIVRLGDGTTSHRGDGSRFEDYYAYGAPVLAAADGEVVSAVNGIAEDPATLRRPEESDEAYAQRVGEQQLALIQRGTDAIAGNHVVLRHPGGEYSVYAHLQPGTVAVAPGDRVRAGQPLGKLGSSGNSTEPHLHFHVCDGPSALDCSGIPVEFGGVRLPWADYPRALQSGDLVEAE